MLLTKLMLIGSLFAMPDLSADKADFSTACYTEIDNLPRAEQLHLFGLATWIDSVADPGLDLSVRFFLALPERCLADLVETAAQ